jgi:hypothetical protein
MDGDRIVTALGPEHVVAGEDRAGFEPGHITGPGLIDGRLQVVSLIHGDALLARAAAIITSGPASAAPPSAFRFTEPPSAG